MGREARFEIRVYDSKLKPFPREDSLALAVRGRRDERRKTS